MLHVYMYILYTNMEATLPVPQTKKILKLCGENAVQAAKPHYRAIAQCVATTYTQNI